MTGLMRKTLLVVWLQAPFKASNEAFVHNLSGRSVFKLLGVP
jgi:hypothetical protein